MTCKAPPPRQRGADRPQKFLLQLAAAIAFTVLLRRDGYLTPTCTSPS